MDVKEYNEIIEWANEKGGFEFKAFMEIIYRAYVDGRWKRAKIDLRSKKDVERNI